MKPFKTEKSLPAATEKRYFQLKEELVELMETIKLHDSRIEQLMDTLAERNRYLMGLEGKLLRLAEGCKIKREEFVEQYRGSEIDPNWIKKNISSQNKGMAKVCR